MAYDNGGGERGGSGRIFRDMEILAKNLKGYFCKYLKGLMDT